MSKESIPAIRRLLVITYHFPPDGTIGGQRWAGLSKYLSRLGWEVHVVTASPAGSGSPQPNVHRHVRRRRRTLNDVYRVAAGRLRGASVASAPSPAVGSTGESSGLSLPIAALRRIVGSSMSLPDHGRGWVVRAAGAARELLRQKAFDVVVTSGPPHSAHFAGALATSGGAVPFWMDMRDPWSMTHEMHVPTDGFVRAERFVLRQMEKATFGRAARVMVNTREFATALGTSDPSVPVTHFPNGIDLEQMPRRDTTAVRHGSICHVGTLYANRSLSSVFAAMSAIIRASPDAANVLRLDLAGPLESPHRERMQEEIAAFGLESCVKLHGVLPRLAALELLSRSHLALVLAQDQPMCVPAKVYESVGLGVPTLVIAENESAAASEARRIGALAADGADVPGIRSVLEDLLARRIPVTMPARAPISYEDLALQMDRLLRGVAAS